MAKIPTFEQLGNAPTPQPGAGVVSDRSASQENDFEGRALAQVGNNLQAVSNELWAFKEKADTVRVEDAWNQYKNTALEVTSGKEGVLNAKAGDAVNGDLLGKSTGRLADARKKIADGLTDDQRRRFDERADVTDMDTKRTVLSHLAQQQVQYNRIVFEGSEAAAKAQVAALPTDPGVFTGARDTLMAQADLYLKQNGVTDKGTAEALKSKLNDSLWVTRINALLYSQPALAESLFRANQSQIKDPELRLVMQNKTREVSMAVVASTAADDIINDTRTELAKPQAPPGLTAVTTPPPTTGAKPDDTKVTPGLQLQRDQNRLRLLEDELKDNPDDAALKKEITNAKASLAKQERAIAAALAAPADRNLRPVANTPEPTVTNTSGLPNSRDIAAQLPVMMAKINDKADALYGKDQGNPDRAAFIKRVTGELQARVSQEVQQLNSVQRQAQGTLLDAVMGIGSAPAVPGLTATGGQPAAPQKITSFSQIQNNPTLMRAYQLMDVQAKIAVDNMIERNLRATDAGNVQLFRDLFNRIHLEDGDPNKINFYQQIVRPDIANNLSMSQIQQLRQELDRNETPGGRSFNQLRKAADTNVSAYFRTNVMFTAQPERQIAATMRWNEEAGKKIDQYVKEGKDVRSLFMLDSKDSIVSPAYLQTFVNSTPAQGLAEGAAAVKAGAAPVNIVRAPATIKTPAEAEAWIQTLPPNVTMFLDGQGQLRQIPARQQGSPAPGGPDAPKVDQTMDATGKLVQPAPVAQEPAIPKLVIRETVAEKAARMKREAEIRRADRGVAIIEGVQSIGRGVRTAQEAASGALVAGAEAVTPPGEAERSARSFRELVRLGSYTPAAEGVILDAMDSGMLTPAEERTARAMLRQLAGQRKK